MGTESRHTESQQNRVPAHVDVSARVASLADLVPSGMDAAGVSLELGHQFFVDLIPVQPDAGADVSSMLATENVSQRFPHADGWTDDL